MVSQTGVSADAGVLSMVPSVSKGVLQRLATGWILLCAACFYLWSLANPHAEWDMLMYAASAEVLNSTPVEEIHPKVYSALETRLAPEEFKRISEGDHYRTVMYEDSGAFLEQLPYYRIRVTFNSLIAFAGNHGVSLYTAGYVISATAFILCFLTIWLSIRQKIHPLLQLTLPLVFYKYTRELEVMQQMLADSLAALWVALMCVAYTRKSAFLLPLIAVSVLVRVDLFIFASLMILVLLLTTRIQKWAPILLTFCVVLFAFLGIQEWADSYGWKTLYYFAILSDMSATHPSIYSQISFSLSDYINSMLFQPRSISRMFLITVILSVMTLVFSNLNRSLTDYQRRVCEVSGICLMYIAAHYVVFPQMYLRFFVAQNMIIFTSFAIVASAYFSNQFSTPGSWQGLLRGRNRNYC